MSRYVTSGGCQCSSCRATNGKAISQAPRGDPVGKRIEKSLYAEHVRACLFNGMVRAIPHVSLDPIAFYVCKATPRAEIRRVLTSTFCRK